MYTPIRKRTHNKPVTPQYIPKGAPPLVRSGFVSSRKLNIGVVRKTCKRVSAVTCQLRPSVHTAMKVPGRKKAVKMAINFILAPSLPVFVMIDCWIVLSRAAIMLLTWEVSGSCPIKTNRPVMTHHSNIDVDMLLQAFDICFVLEHILSKHHQFVVITYLLTAAIQFS